MHIIHIVCNAWPMVSVECFWFHKEITISFIQWCFNHLFKDQSVANRIFLTYLPSRIDQQTTSWHHLGLYICTYSRCPQFKCMNVCGNSWPRRKLVYLFHPMRKASGEWETPRENTPSWQVANLFCLFFVDRYLSLQSFFLQVRLEFIQSIYTFWISKLTNKVYLGNKMLENYIELRTYRN